MAKKEVVIEYGGRSYGKAAVQELVERNNALTASNESLAKETARLKFQIGGYKVSNANYKELVSLSKEKKKRLQEEHELLKEDFKECNAELMEFKQKLNASCSELDKYKAAYEKFMSAHWYERLFSLTKFIVD